MTNERPRPLDRWPAGIQGSELDRLVLRSNLLGSDPRVTNYGGGNTSAKLELPDPVTGAMRRVLAVKGSGGDLGTIGIDGFAMLDLERVLSLEALYRGPDHEDAMVPLLDHCVVPGNGRAPSIDTPLHAYLPFPHVDHVHPDDVIALATARESEQLVKEVYGDALGWLPWQRPGFDLGLRLRDLAAERPSLQGVVLAGHGLFTWGESAQHCFERTVDAVKRATDYVCERRGAGDRTTVVRTAPRSAADRRERAALLLPRLRGAVSSSAPRVAHFDDAEEVLDFVGSADLEAIAARGTSCPDHFLRTKIRPLVLPPGAVTHPGAIAERVAAYRREYEHYYARWRVADSPPMRDAAPAIVLVPGIGMIGFAGDKATARIATEFYRNAIRVMRGADAIGSYQGLSEEEAFGIEYWSLEEAKLRRCPPARPLAGRVALVSGGAGAIGRAIAQRFLDDDACVVLLDIDEQRLHDVVGVLGAGERLHSVLCDVTDEDSVANAYREAALAFGGLDIVVSNAGIAAAAPIEDTSLELWDANQKVLSTGYFLIAREAARSFKAQGRGGAMVFVGSKNGLAASAQTAAYGAAKAAEIQLARVLALELAGDGIRVNVVNPDAVLRESKIWSGRWRAERAAAYGIEPDALEAHYRDRSLLKRDVLPEDVAEAVHFFASDRSAKSTGNILNVDAGHAAAFTR